MGDTKARKSNRAVAVLLIAQGLILILVGIAFLKGKEGFILAPILILFGLALWIKAFFRFRMKTEI